MPCHMSMLLSSYKAQITYVLWSPLLVSHDNTLDDFNAGKTSLFTLCLQLLEDQFVELPVLAHVLEILIINAVLLR